MSPLLFIELEERLSRVHTILSELMENPHGLSAPAADLADEAEELTNEARDILYQGDAYFAAAVGARPV